MTERRSGERRRSGRHGTVRVVRGRAETVADDAEQTRALLEFTGDTGTPAVRVWRPHRQVAFGRRDANAAGYRAAREAAREHDCPPTERLVGGRAVVYTGSTLVFCRTEPVDDPRVGIGERYERVTSAVQRALWRLGVPAQRGEPADTFCPGEYSLSDGGKLVGLAQRVRADAALVAGVVVADDREEFGSVTAAVYDALGVPFDPASVGSVADSGGDVTRLRGMVERALVGDGRPAVRHVP